LDFIPKASMVSRLFGFYSKNFLVFKTFWISFQKLPGFQDFLDFIPKTSEI